MATVTLKATPAKEKPKVAGATKGSWGKTPAKPKESVSGSGVAGDFKTVLSDGTSGFEIPVTKRMFEVDRV